MGETLHGSPRKAEFRIKRRAFCLVPPDGGLLVFVVVVLTAYGQQPTAPMVRYYSQQPATSQPFVTSRQSTTYGAWMMPPPSYADVVTGTINQVSVIRSRPLSY